MLLFYYKIVYYIVYDMMHVFLPTKISFLFTKYILCPEPPPPPSLTQALFFAYKFSLHAFFTLKPLQLFGLIPDFPIAHARSPPSPLLAPHPLALPDPTLPPSNPAQHPPAPPPPRPPSHQSPARLQPSHVRHGSLAAPAALQSPSDDVQGPADSEATQSLPCSPPSLSRPPSIFAQDPSLFAQTPSIFVQTAPPHLELDWKPRSLCCTCKAEKGRWGRGSPLVPALDKKDPFYDTFSNSGGVWGQAAVKVSGCGVVKRRPACIFHLAPQHTPLAPAPCREDLFLITF